MTYHVEPGIVASAIKAAETIDEFLEEHEDMDSVLYEEAVAALSIIRMQLKHTAWQFVPPKTRPSDYEARTAMEAIGDALVQGVELDEVEDEETIQRRVLENEPLNNATLVVELRELVEPLIHWRTDR